MSDKDTVLVVATDDRLTRSATEVLSSICSNKVETVGSIEQAKTILENESVVFMIIDFAFSKEIDEGADLVKSIRRNNRNYKMPILALLAENYLVDKQKQIRDAGVTGYLPRPFNTQSLEDFILDIINNPRNFIMSREYIGPDRRREYVPIKDDKRSKR